MRSPIRKPGKLRGVKATIGFFTYERVEDCDDEVASVKPVSKDVRMGFQQYPGPESAPDSISNLKAVRTNLDFIVVDHVGQVPTAN